MLFSPLSTESNWVLLVDIDLNCLSFRVIEAVLCVNRAKHANPEEEHHEENCHGDQGRPDGYREKADAIVYLAKLPTDWFTVELNLQLVCSELCEVVFRSGCITLESRLIGAMIRVPLRSIDITRQAVQNLLIRGREFDCSSRCCDTPLITYLHVRHHPELVFKLKLHNKVKLGQCQHRR